MTTQAELAWRRGMIIEMRARGLNQMEIAHELHVSEASITADMKYLREQAKQNIKEYVTEKLPEQYQVCLSALNTILKHTFEIVQNPEDNREKLQALELFKEVHIELVNLMSDSTSIDSALNFIRDKQSQSSQQQTKQSPPSSTSSAAAEEQPEQPKQAGQEQVF